MNCKTYQLNDAPNLKRIQVITINNFRQNLVIKQEPLEYPSTEENETHRTMCKEDLKCEELEEHVHIDRTGLGNDDSESGVFTDEQDVKIEELAVDIDNEGWTDDKDIDMTVLEDMNIKSDILIDEEGRRHDEFDEVQYVEDTMQKVLESARDIENKEPEGAAPAKKSKLKNRMLGEQNIPEKWKKHRTTKDIELPTTNTNPYMLRSTKKNATMLQISNDPLTYSDTGMNNRNVKVDSDACINTDIDNSSSKHLKKSFNCKDCANTFDDDLLIAHIEQHKVGKRKNNEKSVSSAQKCAKLRFHKENKHTKRDILKDRFQCDICQRIFTRKVGLYNHLKTHSSEKPFHHRFIKKVSMKKHLKSDSDKTSFECAVCQQSFKRKHYLSVHIKTHSRVTPFECAICQKRFAVKHYLRNHLKTHSGQKPYQCELCARTFRLKAGLDKHLRIHYGDKPFECAICQRRFSVKYSLIYHLRTHSNEKPFECTICNRRFHWETTLRAHLKIHCREKLFDCVICNRGFSEKHNLRLHLRTHTGEKPFECSICQRRFAFKASLNSHLVVHSGDKKFECATCQRRFATKGHLNEHIKHHGAVKAFECAICQRRFHVKYNLSQHIKTHSEEKSFDCTICKRKFTFKSTLNRHLKSHNDDRLFQCVICQRGFNLKHHLNDHLKTHSKEKPFECAVCGRSFNRKNHLNSHLSIHNGEKPFACPICQQRFNRKDNMKNHLRKHSKDKPFTVENTYSMKTMISVERAAGRPEVQNVTNVH